MQRIESMNAPAQPIQPCRGLAVAGNTAPSGAAAVISRQRGSAFSRSPLLLGALSQAEPVPAVVLEDGLDAIALFFRRGNEFDAFAPQFVLRFPAVILVEDARAQRPALHQCANLVGGGFVHPARCLRLVQDNFEIGLALWCDGQPAEPTIHFDILP